jgi:hypothetical protein
MRGAHSPSNHTAHVFPNWLINMQVYGVGVENVEATQMYWWPVKGGSVFCAALPWFPPLFGAQIRSFLLSFCLSYTHTYNGATGVGISDLEKAVKCYDADLNFFGCGMPQAVETVNPPTLHPLMYTECKHSRRAQTFLWYSFSPYKCNHLI